jgi:hypothetical protein
MKKLLAIAGVVVLVALVLLWRSIGDSSATTQRPVSQKQQTAVDPVAKVDVAPKVPVEKPEAPPVDDGKPKKLDPMSDEFFYKFTERVPKVLSADAVECYNHRTGSLHRNAKLVLTFNVKVRNGVATVHDVKIKPPDADDPEQQNNTLADPALESCFIQKVSRATWTDESLPDYDWPDELVLRPERGLKGYWAKNRAYEGAEAPKRDRSVHAKPPEPAPLPPEQ